MSLHSVHSLSSFQHSKAYLSLSVFYFCFPCVFCLSFLKSMHSFVIALYLCELYCFVTLIHHAIALQKCTDIQCLLGGRHQLTGNADRPSVFLLCPMHSPHPSFLLTPE